jgi:hypothetical protein
MYEAAGKLAGSYKPMGASIRGGLAKPEDRYAVISRLIESRRAGSWCRFTSLWATRLHVGLGNAGCQSRDHIGIRRNGRWRD